MKQALVLTVAAICLAAPVVAGSVEGKVECGRSCEDLVVYLEGAPAAEAGSSSVVFDQRDKTFVPHVLPVVRGTQVDITNGDPILHNVHVYRGKETVLNISMPFQGQVTPHTFDESGVYRVLCDAHPEMSAFIVVLDHPWAAAVEEDGSYHIGQVPAGSYTLVVHHLDGDRVQRSAVEVEGG